jgi:hypothetical protein
VVTGCACWRQRSGRASNEDDGQSPLLQQAGAARLLRAAHSIADEALRAEGAAVAVQQLLHPAALRLLGR